MRQPPVDYIERTKALYSHLGYPPYRWVRSTTPAPFTSVSKGLADCNVALISSGGVYRAGQTAFHYRDDTSLREIAPDTPTTELRATHFAYDLEAARSDPNVVFPIDRMRELEREGRIGRFSAAYTFMGGIYSSGKVSELVAPTLAELLISQEVDVVLLVPV